MLHRSLLALFVALVGSAACTVIPAAAQTGTRLIDQLGPPPALEDTFSVPDELNEFEKTITADELRRAQPSLPGGASLSPDGRVQHLYYIAKPRPGQPYGETRGHEIVGQRPDNLAERRPEAMRERLRELHKRRRTEPHRNEVWITPSMGRPASWPTWDAYIKRNQR